MLKNLQRIMYTDFGQILISVLLGLGLASIFRKACKERNCLVFQGPKLDVIKESVYKFNNDCYKFQEKAVKCGTAKQKIPFA